MLKTSCLFGAALSIVLVAHSAASAETEYPVAGKVVQVLAAFDNPEGAIFSADGKTVFVSNAAEIGERGKDFGWTEGEGYISKLSVGDDGTLAMVEEKLISGLTAPLGMAILPVATGKFPAGTIFLCVGSAPLVDADGQVVKDPARLQTKLVAFDEDGEVLGDIDTGAGSRFHEISGGPVALLNAVGFDQIGNLYFADTAFGPAQFEPAFQDRGGVWMIPHGSLDALADGADPAAAPTFLAMPGNPDGVEVSPKDGKIYVNTVGPVAGAPDPAEGGIYALTLDDFKSGTLPTPVDSKLGALDGLDFTHGGVMLNTQIKGDVATSIYVSCPNAKALALKIVGADAALAGPADIAVRRASDGSQLVVIPELMARDNTPGDDEVTVISLPAGFDTAC